ncbi:enoyl-CoA hydratase-related protein [Streptomyces sp. NBC_00365]|uniref:enoyl-CoA hydratase-related protein n=1 Tax=Streptomyces sp. NBC_00365 TaxID=2975726 RepID=UPI00225724B2|nr:enoyl-CoA hydratase-related protein [Streptomyces sp. NBC_00365]MCX5096187.1 enoyl-CoA hydratase-related protein [Streptomyces sp. NBC_00365]
MTTRTGTATVQTEEHDGIFVITLDRPEARNAVDAATTRARAAAVDRLESRDDLRVGILTGTDGVFSAGMDLKAFAAGDTSVVEGRGFADITRTRVTTIPRNIALELRLTCDPLPAERAEQFGLVNYPTEPGQALRRALELAALVACNAPPAVAAVKRVVTERTAFRDEDAFVEQDRIVAPVLGSHDAKEGARAFTERRSPHWQGR